MNRFDRILVVDWSARSAPSPKAPSADAIWIACADAQGVVTEYCRTRTEAMQRVAAHLQAALDQRQRVLAGFDFPFGYPAGFAQALTGEPSVLAVWQWLADRILDSDDNDNNRFDVARAMNAQFPGVGPFWGCPTGVADSVLPDRGSLRSGHGMAERRAVEIAVPKAQPVWKLYTTGSVGSQTLLGLPRLQQLRTQFGRKASVWPFEAPDTPIVLAEIYPSLLDGDVTRLLASAPDMIKDEAQVRVLAQALYEWDDGTLDAAFAAAPPEAAKEEGWILGVGLEAPSVSAGYTAQQPPPLKNDCFALPPGVDWVPVPTALATLRGSVRHVVGRETLPIARAGGRVLASDATAARAHPPRANAAVDGYGFAHASLGPAPHHLPLTGDVAAAGSDAGPVPPGHAVRILTGAAVPPGVDTVVLQEDVTASADSVVFNGPMKPGANVRAAGEDLTVGNTALTSGRMLTPADLGLLSAAGVKAVNVYHPLRVAVLSTGDELVDDAPDTDDTAIVDANRPMLLDILRRWGHAPIDCGIARDDRAEVRAALDAAADSADAILTSGGASAGDEDHISALMRGEGRVSTWRIAMKPGRPLLMGFWKDTPVFGLPGNPVAAFVCTLIFARPALHALAGGPWLDPQGFVVPAAFKKRKKAGRHEYLRARMTPEGRAEVFASEGSGRISGISWADGLVALDHDARDIQPGDPVLYLPLTSFGL
ncbi:MAG: gephyrin-like molybdotransferase Glp [Pseudomonadota bacterium]